MKYFQLYEDYNDEGLSEYEKAQEGGFWGSEASGVLPIAKDTGRILIGLRSESVNEPHTWGNFGGAIGIDDYGRDEGSLTPSDNARKEMMEEIGYRGNMLMIDSYVFKNEDFIYYNFLGIIPNEHDITEDNTILNWEVDDIKWVTLEELANQEGLHFGLQSLIENAYEQIKDIVKR